MNYLPKFILSFLRRIPSSLVEAELSGCDRNVGSASVRNAAIRLFWSYFLSAPVLLYSGLLVVIPFNAMVSMFYVFIEPITVGTQKDP